MFVSLWFRHFSTTSLYSRVLARIRQVYEHTRRQICRRTVKTKLISKMLGLSRRVPIGTLPSLDISRGFLLMPMADVKLLNIPHEA
jgi:hypothetical protein